MARLNYGTGTGIQTLMNTYSPPTNIDQQAADQVMRAGQTNVAAQNLANQQAATYANMFPPRMTTEDSVGGTTNTGLTTQDLINDYLQSQGLNMNNLNPAIDYYNIGNIGFNPLENNNFYDPMNSTIDFSSLPIVTDPNAPQGFVPVGIATLGR